MIKVIYEQHVLYNTKSRMFQTDINFSRIEKLLVLEVQTQILFHTYVLYSDWCVRMESFDKVAGNVAFCCLILSLLVKIYCVSLFMDLCFWAVEWNPLELGFQKWNFFFLLLVTLLLLTLIESKLLSSSRTTWISEKDLSSSSFSSRSTW